MGMVDGPGEICGIIMNLMVDVHHQDYNKLWNHLLSSERTPIIMCDGVDGVNKLAVSGKVLISWSQQEIPLPYKEGERFTARITADCFSGGGVDEEMSDKMNMWITYRIWTCDASKVEILE